MNKKLINVLSKFVKDLELIKCEEVSLPDGTVVIFDKLEKDMEIFTKDADGNKIPLADGTYIFEDKSEVTVVAGLITEVKLGEPVKTDETKQVDEVKTEEKSTDDKPVELPFDVEKLLKLLVDVTDGEYSLSFIMKEGKIEFGEVESIDKVEKELEAKMDEIKTKMASEYDAKLGKVSKKQKVDKKEETTPKTRKEMLQEQVKANKAKSIF